VATPQERLEGALFSGKLFSAGNTRDSEPLAENKLAKALSGG
jgi:hypothetical protein